MDRVVATRPAGFWIRAVALVIDVVLYVVVHASLSLLARFLWGPGLDGRSSAEGEVGFFTLVFAIAYTTTLHTLTGQTIGKAVVGVRVVAAADGALLTVGPALLRHLAYFVSAVPFGFGFVVAGLRADKRALHDLIAGSRVERMVVRRLVRRSAAPPPPPGPTLQDAAVAPAPSPPPGPGAGA
jgi:uncharacterized RDD family membrane protein YckC